MRIFETAKEKFILYLLTDFLDFVNNIYDINNGGCAVVAYGAYKLIKSIDKDADIEIIYCYNGFNHYKLEDNARIMNGEGTTAYSCSHAVIKYNGIYFDSRGVHKTLNDKYSYLQTIVGNVDNFMVASLNNIYQWNTCFERETKLDMIENKLGFKLGILKK